MDVGFVYVGEDGTRAAIYVPPKIEVPTMIRVRKADGVVVDLHRMSSVPS